jgi:uncharacterized protein YcaQ
MTEEEIRQKLAEIEEEWEASDKGASAFCEWSEASTHYEQLLHREQLRKNPQDTGGW